MMNDDDEFRAEPINLTAEQWVGLLSADGQWLPRCCGSTSAARDALATCLRDGGVLHVDQAVRILCEIGDHDGPDFAIRPILDGCGAWVEGGTPEFTGRRIFWTREGSPWFEIVRACRVLLGEGNIIEEARERRKAEIAQAVTSKNEQRKRDASRIARSFHDASERLAPQFEWAAIPYDAVPDGIMHRAESAFSELLAHGVIEASDGQLPPVEAVQREPERVTIGVQINGRTIGTINVRADASPEEALRIALADYRVANHVRDAAVSIEKYKPGAVMRLVTA